MSSSASSHSATGPKRVAVIGGGLSGLTAAHRLIESNAEQAGDVAPVEVVVFESSDRLGGVIATRRVGDYLVETGADSFITNQPAGVELCRRLGLADQLIGTDERYRRSLVLRNGRPVPTPDGFQLMVPGRLWPIVTSELFTLRGKLRMLMERGVPRKQDAELEDESVAAFVRRRFGQEALDRIVQPMVGGIYTSDPERLSLRATLPRFLEMEREWGSLIRAVRRLRNDESGRSDESTASGARYGLFVSLEQGMSQLLETLAERVGQQCDVRLETRVATVVQGSRSRQTSGNRPGPNSGESGYNRVVLEMEDGMEETFDGVVIATSARVAGRLLTEWQPTLADELAGIEYASTAIVCTGHRLAEITHPLDAFGLVIPHLEGRRILAVSFLSRKFAGRAPADHVQLRTFIGGAMQPEMLTHTDAELIDIVREELRDIFGVQGEPDFATVTRYDDGMPQYHVGHLDRLARIERLVSEMPGVLLAGNSYHGVGIPDCIHSGEDAATAIHRFAMDSRAKR